MFSWEYFENERIVINFTGRNRQERVDKATIFLQRLITDYNIRHTGGHDVFREQARNPRISIMKGQSRYYFWYGACYNFPATEDLYIDDIDAFIWPEKEEVA